MADIEDAAKRVLLRARQQADQLLAAAQTEAVQLKVIAMSDGHAEGHRKGMAEGLEQGRKAGEAQALKDKTAELQAAIAAMTKAAAVLNDSRSDLEASALAEVIKLAIAIARRVTKRQGLIEPQVFTANLEEAMKLVVQQVDLRIGLHPSQRKTFDTALPALALKWPNLKHVEITEEPGIAPGGCRISTRHGSIDAELDVQLDRVAADLLPIPQETPP